MKAEINANGVMLVTPENQTEAFALRMWAEHSQVVIQVPDMTNMQQRGDTHWNFAKLILDASWPTPLEYAI